MELNAQRKFFKLGAHWKRMVQGQHWVDSLVKGLEYCHSLVFIHCTLFHHKL